MSADISPTAVIAEAVRLGVDPWSAAGRTAAYRSLGIEDFGAVETEERNWVAYTPAWTAAGTAPALGAGTLAGAGLRVGKTGSLWVQLTAGADTTFGTGQWSLSLPAHWVAKRATDLNVTASDGTNWAVGRATIAAGAALLTPKLAEKHTHVATANNSGVDADTIATTAVLLAAVDVDSPWTWGNNYWLRVTGQLELQ
jgi:transcription elongation factor